MAQSQEYAGRELGLGPWIEACKDDRLKRLLLERHLLQTLPGHTDMAGYAAAWALNEKETAGVDVRRLSSLYETPTSIPQRGSLHLWVGAPRGSISELLDCCIGTVVPSEIDRARLFRREQDAGVFLAAHAGLRLMLSAMLACNPTDLLFGTGVHGKPTLDAVGERPAPANLQFNLSHSGERVFIGIASTSVGVDIEAIKEFPDRTAIAKLIFSRATQAALGRLDDTDQIATFYRFWVLGEAYIKMTGLGIGQGLETFTFTAKGAPRLTEATPGLGPPERWRFGLLNG